MHSHLAQEWSAAWPLPAIAIGLLVVLAFLRAVVDPAERGRVKAGMFFAGAYLAMITGFALVQRPLPAPGHHDWLRVLAVLLLCFALVIAASLLVFDVVLRRREMPRILRDLLQGVAYLITAAFVLTRSDVDVARVFTASVLTTAVIGLALQDTLGNVMAGLALQLERDFEVGDWINVGDRNSPIIGRIREVSPQADPVTRLFQVKVGLDNPPPEFFLGVTVSGAINLDTSPVMTLPLTAVIESDGKPSVWVVDPVSNTVTLRPVDILRYDPSAVIVASGLRDGEVVVTAGVNVLHPGQKVKLLSGTS